MGLWSKYKLLVDAVREHLADNVQCTEQEGLLIIRGAAPSAEVKNKLWDIYSQIDPNFISGEVVLDVYVLPEVKGCRACLLADEPSLNVRKGPGIEPPVVGQIGKEEVVTVLGRAHEYWWLIRTDHFEGYCYAPYLREVDDQ